MANQPILPAALLAQLDQARAIILSAYREKPCEGGIIPDIAAAYIYINDWAFLNSHGYVNISGSKEREARYQYACLFHSRKQGEDTQIIVRYLKRTGKGSAPRLRAIQTQHLQADRLVSARSLQTGLLKSS
jgi:hypothetical protein